MTGVQTCALPIYQIIDRNTSGGMFFFLTRKAVLISFVSIIFFLSSVYLSGNGLIIYQEFFKKLIRELLQFIIVVIILDIILIFIAPIIDKIITNKLQKELLLKK